jgi:hypothetical protein
MGKRGKGWSVWLERSADNWRCRWKGKHGVGQRVFIYKDDAHECAMERRRHFQRSDAGLPVGSFINELAATDQAEYRFDEFAHFSKHLRQNSAKIFSAYQSSAKARNLDFTLSEAEFLAMWGKPCFYCGGALAKIGIDRFSNALGYIRGNIVACCRKCNFMKHNMEAADFISQCETISRHYRDRAHLAPL